MCELRHAHREQYNETRDSNARCRNLVLTFAMLTSKALVCTSDSERVRAVLHLGGRATAHHGAHEPFLLPPFSSFERPGSYTPVYWPSTEPSASCLSFSTSRFATSKTLWLYSLGFASKAAYQDARDDRVSVQRSYRR